MERYASSELAASATHPITHEYRNTMQQLIEVIEDEPKSNSLKVLLAEPDMEALDIPSLDDLWDWSRSWSRVLQCEVWRTAI